jgi:hypothetical protein
MSNNVGGRKKRPNIDYKEPHVLFECLHESTDQNIVMGLYRRVRLGLGVGLCAECEDKKRKEELVQQQEERVLKSVASALEDGLSPINGTRAQVEWAEKIRADFFQELKRQSLWSNDPIYNDEERGEAREVLDAIRAEASERVEAKWWIESQHRDKPGLHIISLCEEAIVRLREVEDGSRFAASTCGHSNAFYPFGPLRKKLCAVCQMEVNKRTQIQVEHHIELLSVVEQIKAGLSTLEGSKKQVDWADKIRESFFHLLLGLEKKNKEGIILRRVCREAAQQTKAKWWIDQPNRDVPEGLYQNLKSMLETGAKLPTKGGLPGLAGSAEQVSWADEIRRHFFSELRHREAKEVTQEGQEALAKLHQQMLAQTTAGEWIAQASEAPASYITRMYEYITKLK